MGWIEYPHIAGWLEVNEKPIAVVVEATRRKEYYNPLITRRNPKDPSPLIGALLPSVQKCREMATILSSRAMLRISEGKFDAAWEDILACHRLARLVGRGASLIELLVSVAIETIAQNAALAWLERAPLTSAQIRARMKELQSLPPVSSVVEKVDLLERFLYLETLQLIRRGHFTLLEVFGNRNATEEEMKLLDRIDWTPGFRNGNRWYDRMVNNMKIRDRVARNQAMEQFETDLRALKKKLGEMDLSKVLEGTPAGDDMSKLLSDILIAQFAPGTMKVRQAANRLEQNCAQLQIAFALAAFHKDRKKCNRSRT